MLNEKLSIFQIQFNSLVFIGVWVALVGFGLSGVYSLRLDGNGSLNDRGWMFS